MGLGFAFVAQPVITTFLGNKWQDAVIVIQVVAPLMAIQSLVAPYQALAMSVGQTKLQWQRDLYSFFVRVPMIILGLTYYGLYGFLLGRALASTINVFFSMTVVRKILGVTELEQLRKNTRALLASSLMAALLWSLHACGADGNNPVEQILIEVIVGGCTYITAIFSLWAVMGRPNGAETEILHLASSMRAKLIAFVS